MMDFKDLTYLDAIDRFRNLTKAAEALYITQPALSNFLHNLEKELNIELFRWNGNTMAPTPAGVEYLSFARQVLSEKRALDNQLQLHEYGKGSLRIGIPFSRTTSFIPALLEFDKKYPDTEIQIVENSYKNLNRMLRNCELDLTFTNNPEPDPHTVDFLIAEEEIWLYISEAFPIPEVRDCDFSKYPWVDIHALYESRFLCPPSSQMLGNMTQMIFDELNFHPEKQFVLKNIQAERTLAEAGYGLCFLSERRGHASHRKSLYAFGTHPYVNRFVASHSRKMKFPLMAEEFIRIVRESLK